VKTNVKWMLLVVGAVAMASCPFAAMAAEKPEGVFTLFRVLVGHSRASEGGAADVLVIPGPFVFVGRSPEQDARNVLQLIDSLKTSYGLAEVTLSGTSFGQLTSGKEVEVPVPGSGLRVGVTLLDFDATKAAYAVKLTKAGEPSSEAKVVVMRNERGLIGTRDGPEAPYVFLGIEPVRYPKLDVQAPAVMPKLIHQVQPVYPPEARKAGIDGVVLLEATIGTDGTVQGLRPFRSEPMGLTEAAEAAVRQWRYEPARNAAGKPVAVGYTVTVSFMLDRSKPPATKK
jgi:TonB family protein